MWYNGTPGIEYYLTRIKYSAGQKQNLSLMFLRCKTALLLGPAFLEKYQTILMLIDVFLRDNLNFMVEIFYKVENNY